MDYFDHPVTNAYTESLNNLIRAMNRLGRKYSFEVLQAKVLFTEGIHKNYRQRPKFQRRTEQIEVISFYPLCGAINLKGSSGNQLRSGYINIGENDRGR